MLAEMSGWNHINVSELVQTRGLHGGRNEEWDCFVMDEDKVCDALEETMVKGGNVVDFHGCDFFPERWFHLVVVLRTKNDVLFPRLKKRGYSAKKISENVEAEIMQVVLDEAKSAYKSDIVVALDSNTVEQLEANVGKLSKWMKKADAEMKASQAGGRS